jgi:hypothetical protein
MSLDVPVSVPTTFHAPYCPGDGCAFLLGVMYTLKKSVPYFLPLLSIQPDRGHAFTSIIMANREMGKSGVLNELDSPIRIHIRCIDAQTKKRP